MRSVFLWLDANPRFYWLPAVLSALALVAWIAAGFRPTAPGQPSRRATWIYAALLLAFLLAWRWPFLLCAHEYNPDESQFIAGALTLAHDPVFWRSVDGTTSGPLNFYALLPLRWLGLPLDYFTVRLTGLLLCWGSLLGLFRLLRSFAPPAVAQLATFSGAVFFAVALKPDFVHYSSELVPLALLGLALGGIERRPLLAAFLAGLLPWAKLQALPLAAVLVGWQLFRARQQAGTPRLGRAAGIIGCAALPSALALGLVAACGQFDFFYRRYLTQNAVYAGSGHPLNQVVREFWQNSQPGYLFPCWALGGVLLVVAGAAACGKERRQPSVHFWLGAALTGAAIFCVLLPARTSLHYLLFLTVPLTLWVGAALAEIRARPGAVAMAGLLVALVPLGWRLAGPVPDMFGEFSTHWRQPHSQLGSVLRHWRAPGARLTVWGWLNSAYAESGLPQGVRDMLTVWSILPSPQRDYYRASYLSDLQHNRPEIFIDAVGPGAPFIRDRATEGHETFPALAAYIREHYRLVVDVMPARVYVRNDFLAAHPLPVLELQRLVARGRLEFTEPVEPDLLAPATAPRTHVDGRDVQMLEPPAAMTWRLDGTERKVRLAFGFHPKAYTEGRTDGAGFIAELRMPGQPPLRIFERLLDPQHRPGDRGPLAAEVEIPPFPPGTVLVVHTTAGNAGDTAWDWVYFDRLRFAHSPFFSPRQFPGFRRIPDRLEADYPYLLGEYPDQLLMLPPPAALTFVLDGSERQLNFSYGFQTGAYTGEGRTDGAVYQVELWREGDPPRLLFEHRLDPLHDAGNRGPQHADTILTADVRAGDRLVLRISPGAGTSWDWTYVSALDLR